MTQDDIIKLAREAGMCVGTNLSGVVLVGSPAEIGLAHLTIEELERFAALVAAAERESLPDRRIVTAAGDPEDYINAGWNYCIEAIRARGNK